MVDSNSSSPSNIWLLPHTSSKCKDQYWIRASVRARVMARARAVAEVRAMARAVHDRT